MSQSQTPRLDWTGKSVLVTGGTGSFGKKFVEIMLREYRPERVIVFSRDELKQHEMRQVFSDREGKPMRYFIGDVRDRDRLRRAFQGVQIVVHAAAMKQVPSCEYNPIEAVMTNVDGASNVISAALDAGVERVLALSTDKAVNPVNLYGATKLVAEKLFVQGNAYAGTGHTRFSCTRYGNVVGSRGSVIPLFLSQRSSGVVTVTDARMTRFWITLDQGVRFVIACIERMMGGEIFVPKLPSTGIMDIAAVAAPGCKPEFVGIRAGEKLHEVLVSEDEARTSVEHEDLYVVLPPPSSPVDQLGPATWFVGERAQGKPLPEGFRYGSETNPWRVDGEELQALMGGQAPVTAR
jgi:UDP-N-acetylglucosamine 4,6-dehydratase